MPTASSYDEVPYESHAFAQTHPDHLATVATLLGMRPKPVDGCRVLEVGCAAGGNLIPMAMGLPASTFMGVELSAVQSAQGQQMIGDLGLKNIELRQFDITAVGTSFGKFDYIICHGVYSWVPPHVQDHILRVCRENLAPQGVAYVSYNTYPGWHMRMMIREMMCYHAQHFSEPKMRTAQARKLLDFLADSTSRQNSTYGQQLKAEVEVLRRSQDSYLYHEHLEPCNEPLYFHQFIDRARSKGLQYLGEAQLDVMLPANYPPEIAKVLQMLSADDIHLEQYMDFLRNRMFRQTLLCHQHIVRNTGLRAEQLSAFHVGSAMRPKNAKLDLASTEAEEFQTADGLGVTIGEPLLKAALCHLAEVWPQAVAFNELRSIARGRLGGPPVDANVQANDIQTLGRLLLSCYGTASDRLIELHVYPPRFSRAVAERPLASPLARLQARTNPLVTNLRHSSVGLDSLGRQLLPHLDGHHDHASLTQLMVEAAQQGNLTVEKDGQPIQEPAKLTEVIYEAVAEQLRRFAVSALLMP